MPVAHGRAGTFHAVRSNSGKSPSMQRVNPEEIRLLRRLAEGDTGAVAEIYRLHADRVFRFALAFLANRELAEDVTQETFMQLIDHPHRFDPAKGALANYLCGIARNLARNTLDPREVALDAEEAWVDTIQSPDREPLVQLLANEQADALLRAVRQIPAHYRDVLILAEFEDKSYAEIAAITGVELGTVRSRLNRARGHLAKLLGIEATSVNVQQVAL